MALPNRCLTALLLAGACADRPLDLPAHREPPDLAAPDLSKPDLSPPPDLATPDLLGVPFCQLVTVSTLAGNGTYAFMDGSGGPNGTAEFAYPAGVALDRAGNLYVADFVNSRIRKLAPDGTTTTLTGGATAGFADGTGGAQGTTQLNGPSGVAVDDAGNVYVADYGNSRIRKVAPDGATTTLAGDGTLGYVDGSGGPNGTTQFHYPYAVALDGAGTVYVGDQENFVVRKLAADGATTTLAGNGHYGFADGPNAGAEFFYANGIAADALGNVFVADSSNSRVRKISGGVTSTLAGNGTYAFFDGSGGPAGTTEFREPWGIAVGAGGYLYVSDPLDNRIRRVAPDGTTVTVAGDGTQAWRDGPGCSAQLSEPFGIAVSGKTLFIGDTENNRIRKIQLPE